MFLAALLSSVAHPSATDDQASTAVKTVAVDSSWAKTATDAIMSTALRSESAGSLRMLVPA